MCVPGRILRFVGIVCLLGAGFCAAVENQEPDLTKDQIKEFLLTAKVIKSKQVSKGITHPWRLTLSDGTFSHDAHFQAIDEHKSVMQMASGRMETNFVDSYKYNIAAFVLAEMLGLDNMVPASVERKWQGDTGSMTWWLSAKMDDAERHKRKIEPPDPDAWNKQMYRVRVFDQLIYDTDANLGNLLIGEDWHVWRVDFTRAFRTYKTLQRPGDLQHCDRPCSNG